MSEGALLRSVIVGPQSLAVVIHHSKCRWGNNGLCLLVFIFQHDGLELTDVVLQDTLKGKKNRSQLISVADCALFHQVRSCYKI